MNFIEVKDPEVDVERIMETIRENVKKKKELGIYTDKEIGEISRKPLSVPTYLEMKDNLFSSQLQRLRKEENSKQGKPIASHRPFIGVFIVLAKRMFRAFAQPFINEILNRQEDFNAHLVDTLFHFSSTMKEIIERQERQESMLRDLDGKLDASNEENKRTLTKYNEETSQQISQVRKHLTLNHEKLDRFLEGLSSFSGEFKEESVQEIRAFRDSQLDHIYSSFEDTFRGTPAKIMEQQRHYLPFFQGLTNILDVGCGRGEFLNLLKEAGVQGKGIDINEAMVASCREKGLDVEQKEAFAYLRDIGDESLGGIFLSHFIEHITSDAAVEFVYLAFRKIQKGGVFIAETPNPLSLVTSASHFYRDLTHVKPVHPDGLQHLLMTVGFADVQVKFLSPVEEGQLLKLLQHNHGKIDSQMEVLNDNFQRLNDLLFGYQDVAIIAKK